MGSVVCTQCDFWLPSDTLCDRIAECGDLYACVCFEMTWLGQFQGVNVIFGCFEECFEWLSKWV